MGVRGSRPRRWMAACGVWAALAMIPAGCGPEQERQSPVACQAGRTEIRAALESAPELVTVDGTRLSECLTDQSDGGSLLDVGQTYVTIAIELADGAQRHPDGRAAVELGYLVGALRRGGAGAQGVGYELKRRIDSELHRVDTSSTAFQRGLRAGRRTG